MVNFGSGLVALLCFQCSLIISASDKHTAVSVKKKKKHHLSKLTHQIQNTLFHMEMD